MRWQFGPSRAGLLCDNIAHRSAVQSSLSAAEYPDRPAVRRLWPADERLASLKRRCNRGTGSQRARGLSLEPRGDAFNAARSVPRRSSARTAFPAMSGSHTAADSGIARPAAAGPDRFDLAHRAIARTRKDRRLHEAERCFGWDGVGIVNEHAAGDVSSTRWWRRRWSPHW